MPVRLACVKHTTSVRSEPGSNSQILSSIWLKSLLTFSHILANTRTNKEIANLIRTIAFILLLKQLKYSQCKTATYCIRNADLLKEGSHTLA